MRSLSVVLFLVYRAVNAQNQTTMRCDLPENINQLPEFAQEEIRAVWKNYVPGDDCKQELIITEDILAVLDMLDKDLGRQSKKPEAIIPVEIRNGDQFTTSFPTKHETLIPTRSIETGLTINNTFPSLQLTTTSTFLSPIVRASDSIISSTNIPSSAESEIDYSDFTTTTIPETSTHTTSNLPEKSMETSHEQPFSFTGSPSVTFTPEFTPTTQLVLDYVEAREEETVTSRAVRVMKVKIPTDYEEFEKQQQKHTNGYIERKKDFKPEKIEKTFDGEKFYESQEPQLPFLKGVNQQVVRLFKEVMKDPDIINEQRRQDEIHLLAVSYLNAKQLLAFNAWSSQRRKRIRAREQVLQPLSFKARETLKHLALTPSEQQQRATAMNLHGELRDELKAFAIRLREQHQPVDDYRHKHV